MTTTQYSYHREFYNAALKSLAEQARKLMAVNGLSCIGWLKFMKKSFPNHYRKLITAEQTINKLWGKNDTRTIEEWKTAVRQSLEGTIWAVEQYFKNRPKEGPSL